MALIIENGTGVTGAQSFETVAECEAFALSFYGSNLTGSQQSKESALWRAFVFMSGLRWLPDTFPTFGGTIPDAVKHAQSVFARAEHSAPNSLSPTITLGGSKVLTKVGSIGWTPLQDKSTVESLRPVVTQGFDFIRDYLEFDPSRDGSGLYPAVLVV
ncbi:MAG: DnaT-like ssDNA-binding protein [Cypionkella sp.]|nr:DnaT-like ssDNA-binding protein [Cypionkella sp.]